MTEQELTGLAADYISRAGLTMGKGATEADYLTRAVEFALLMCLT